MAILLDYCDLDYRKFAIVLGLKKSSTSSIIGIFFIVIKILLSRYSRKLNSFSKVLTSIKNSKIRTTWRNKIKIRWDQMYLIVWHGRTIIVENSSDKKLRTTNVLLFLLSFPSRATTTTYVFTTHKQNYVLFFLFVSWHLLFKAF